MKTRTPTKVELGFSQFPGPLGLSPSHQAHCQQLGRGPLAAQSWDNGLSCKGTNPKTGL